ncbi:MAG: hypothetical protein HQ511_01710 [Rhodospirillales bacterium]|nr:hypothetical protein [Rhodospirillales bacterium]
MNDNMIDVKSLPFVTKSSNGSRHRFWTPVQPSSDWLEDEQKGIEFALAYLTFEITNGAGPILSLILNDMIEAGDRGTVAKSFSNMVGGAMIMAIRSTVLPRIVESLRQELVKMDMP